MPYDFLISPRGCESEPIASYHWRCCVSRHCHENAIRRTRRAIATCYALELCIRGISHCVAEPSATVSPTLRRSDWGVCGVLLICQNLTRKCRLANGRGTVRVELRMKLRFASLGHLLVTLARLASPRVFVRWWRNCSQSTISLSHLARRNYPAQRSGAPAYPIANLAVIPLAKTLQRPL